MDFFFENSLDRSRAGRHFYGTENDIWAGGNTEKIIGGWYRATFEGGSFMFSRAKE